MVIILNDLSKSTLTAIKKVRIASGLTGLCVCSDSAGEREKSITVWLISGSDSIKAVNLSIAKLQKTNGKSDSCSLYKENSVDMHVNKLIDIMFNRFFTAYITRLIIIMKCLCISRQHFFSHNIYYFTLWGLLTKGQPVNQILWRPVVKICMAWDEECLLVTNCEKDSLSDKL